MSKKEVLTREQQALAKLLELPENKLCADCGVKAPKWASFSLGYFVCLECSGIHRQIGTHITRMKSTTLDKWDQPWVDVCARVGNVRINAVYEARLGDRSKKLRPSSTMDERETYIRRKYERREFYGQPTRESLARACQDQDMKIEDLPVGYMEGVDTTPRASTGGESAVESKAMNPALMRRQQKKDAETAGARAAQEAVERAERERVEAEERARWAAEEQARASAAAAARASQAALGDLFNATTQHASAASSILSQFGAPAAPAAGASLFSGLSTAAAPIAPAAAVPSSTGFGFLGSGGVGAGAAAAPALPPAAPAPASLPLSSFDPNPSPLGSLLPTSSFVAAPAAAPAAGFSFAGLNVASGAPVSAPAGTGSPFAGLNIAPASAAAAVAGTASAAGGVPSSTGFNFMGSTAGGPSSATSSSLLPPVGDVSSGFAGLTIGSSIRTAAGVAPSSSSSTSVPVSTGFAGLSLGSNAPIVAAPPLGTGSAILQSGIDVFDGLSTAPAVEPSQPQHQPEYGHSTAVSAVVAPTADMFSGMSAVSSAPSSSSYEVKPPLPPLHLRHPSGSGSEYGITGSGIDSHQRYPSSAVMATGAVSPSPDPHSALFTGVGNMGEAGALLVQSVPYSQMGSPATYSKLFAGPLPDTVDGVFARQNAVAQIHAKAAADLMSEFQSKQKALNDAFQGELQRLQQHMSRVTSSASAGGFGSSSVSTQPSIPAWSPPSSSSFSASSSSAAAASNSGGSAGLFGGLSSPPAATQVPSYAAAPAVAPAAAAVTSPSAGSGFPFPSSAPAQAAPAPAPEPAPAAAGVGSMFSGLTSPAGSAVSSDSTAAAAVPPPAPFSPPSPAAAASPAPAPAAWFPSAASSSFPAAAPTEAAESSPFGGSGSSSMFGGLSAVASAPAPAPVAAAPSWSAVTSVPAAAPAPSFPSYSSSSFQHLHHNDDDEEATGPPPAPADEDESTTSAMNANAGAIAGLFG